MLLYLVHHGLAEAAAIDLRRPLSPTGVTWVQGLADTASRRGMSPMAFWHSGKLRAKQTATIFWQACQPLAALKAVRGMQAGDPPAWIRDRLVGETGDVALVGHLPHLALVRELLTGALPDTFPAHGVVALEEIDGRWVERWTLVAPAPSDA